MPGTISHALSMTSPNDPTYENQPQHWNSSHLFTLNAIGSEVSGAFGTNGNVTFTYDGTNINANAGTAAPSPVNISAGNTSNNLQTIVFSNSNGVSFGLSGSTITGTVATNYQSQGAYLTTAMQSDRGSDFVQATAGFAGTSASGTIASNGISVSIGPYITTGALSNHSHGASAANGSFAFQTLSFSNANNFTFATSAGSAIVGSYTVPTVTNSSWTVSDAGTSGTVGRLAFTNLNGVTLSLSTGAGGSHTIVGSHNALTSQSNQAVSNSAGSFTFQTLNFSNANNVTWGTSAGGIITASVASPGAAAENNAINLLGANTAGNTTATGSTIGWSGLNLTLSGTNNSQVVISAPATSSLSVTGFLSLSANGSTISLGAGPLSFFATGNTTQSTSGTIDGRSITFQGAGGASVGISNGSIVISGGTAGGGGIGGISNSQTMYNSGTVILTEGGGAITIGSDTGQHFSFSVPQTSSIVGTNGLSVSTNGSTISVLPRWISSYENMEGPTSAISSAWTTGSVSHAVAFNVPWALSMSFIRIPISMTTQSTTISTIASNTASAQAGLTHTFNAGIYSLGVGASSLSLQNVTTGTATHVMSMKISITSSTRASYSLAFSGQVNGGQTSLSTQYSVSNTNYSFTTNQIATAFSGLRFLDIPCAASLTPGAYWMVIGMSSSTSSGGNTALSGMTNCNVIYSNHYAVSMINSVWGIMGSTDFTSGGLLGAGSFSTAGGGTTNSLPISAISSNASQARLYFQMLRSA